jgi:hypothetical protein
MNAVLFHLSDSGMVRGTGLEPVSWHWRRHILAARRTQHNWSEYSESNRSVQFGRLPRNRYAIPAYNSMLSKILHIADRWANSRPSIVANLNLVGDLRFELRISRSQGERVKPFPKSPKGVQTQTARFL